MKHAKTRIAVWMGVCMLIPKTGWTELEPPSRNEPSLSTVFAPAFPIGMSISPRSLSNPATWALVRHHCTRVTLENDMKPGRLQPRPGTFTFAVADDLVAAALKAGMTVHGHTLVWHRQSPDWFFENAEGVPVTPETALRHLRTHIHTVMTHFQGRIDSWDVVNEALADGPGTNDFRTSPWFHMLGDTYVLEAFRAAAKADPAALLFYNDYGLETEPKRSRALRLVETLRAAGVRIDGIGIQAHLQVDGPPITEIEASIQAFADAGLLIHISELDVSVLPWRTPGSKLLEEDRRFEHGLSEDMHRRQSRRYRDLFELFLRHRDVIQAVTFWNTHDGDSWLNQAPIRGRVDHPLLFDRQLQPKPAFHAVTGRFEQTHASIPIRSVAQPLPAQEMAPASPLEPAAIRLLLRNTRAGKDGPFSVEVRSPELHAHLNAMAQQQSPLPVTMDHMMLLHQAEQTEFRVTFSNLPKLLKSRIETRANEQIAQSEYGGIVLRGVLDGIHTATEILLRQTALLSLQQGANRLTLSVKNLREPFPGERTLTGIIATLHAQRKTMDELQMFFANGQVLQLNLTFQALAVPWQSEPLFLPVQIDCRQTLGINNLPEQFTVRLESYSF